MNSFYSEEELKMLGLGSYGENVLISRNAKFYGASKIHIGSNVRIDDFCILSGRITIGNYVHVSAGAFIYAGDAGVTMNDFSCISSRTVVSAVSDDYSGEYMTNPMVPEEFTNVDSRPVYIGKHTLVGSGCTILPGVVVGDGASVGAMSLINKDIEEYTINAGIPCRKIKDRSKNMLELEQQFIKRR